MLPLYCMRFLQIHVKIRKHEEFLEDDKRQHSNTTLHKDLT